MGSLHEDLCKFVITSCHLFFDIIYVFSFFFQTWFFTDSDDLEYQQKTSKFPFTGFRCKGKFT